MLRTRFCELMEVEVPVLQAAIAPYTPPELVAAVSNAGALGTVSTGFQTIEQVRSTIRRTQELTDRPFVVNFVTPRHYGEMLKRQFDRLYAEGEESGTVMCIPLHPYLIGQPYRIKAFEEALAYITRHDKVWLATGREIAKHFLDHHYDQFAAASVPVGEAP